MTKNESVIHGNEEIPGVNTPLLNFGMFGTSFGIHHEDGNLGSINKLQGGKAKTWYSVPSTQVIKLEKFVQNNVTKSIAGNCKRFIRHKAVITPPELVKNDIDPSELVKNDIDFAKVGFLVVPYFFSCLVCNNFYVYSQMAGCPRRR